MRKKKNAKTARAKSKGKSEGKAKIKTNIGTRGRTFTGKVTRKFPKRITIEFERMVYFNKYERYAKFRTKIHARLPEELEDEVNIGDRVEVRECRPLSKTIHFIATRKINTGEEK
ncbi:30S ribosomal protein S17 [Candidatus Pacearchaeota archaeon]|nr:30S ribosomal protein S17 [Candidatus Pacearchaeota archaeon]